MSYTLHKAYCFKVCGEEFAVTANNGFRIQIEETRKNGQEDCHMSGELVKRDGIWTWADDWAKQQFIDYGNRGVVEAIPKYITDNPLPEEFS